MAFTVAWSHSVLGSVLHAADLLVRGRRLTDPRLQQSLAVPAKRLETAVQDLLGDRDAWETALQLACQSDDIGQLVSELSSRGSLGEIKSADLRGAVADVADAMHSVVPDLAEQLVQRQRPLRDQWEVCGPGMMAGLQAACRLECQPAEPKIVLVLPAAGGGGGVAVELGLVRFEAVLANRHQELPEIVRLAWLLARVVCAGCGDATATNPRDRSLRRALVWGTLAAAIAAAEAVDVCRCDQRTLELAVSDWELDSTDAKPAAGLLIRWWEEWRDRSDRSQSWESGLRQLAATLDLET